MDWPTKWHAGWVVLIKVPRVFGDRSPPLILVMFLKWTFWAPLRDPCLMLAMKLAVVRFGESRPSFGLIRKSITRKQKTPWQWQAAILDSPLLSKIQKKSEIHIPYKVHIISSCNSTLNISSLRHWQTTLVPVSWRPRIHQDRHRAPPKPHQVKRPEAANEYGSQKHTFDLANDPIWNLESESISTRINSMEFDFHNTNNNI